VKAHRQGTRPRSRRQSAKNHGAARAKLRVPVALLAAALRAQSEGVLIAKRVGLTPELTILFVNDSLCAMVGRRAAEIVGQRQGMLHADEADAVRLQDWFVTARSGEPLTGDGFLRRRDGTTFNATWSFDPLFNARGRLTHIVATYRDQTERRRLQEMLVHAQRLDAVGRLAGGVAHDFSNQISVINGYCEMLATRVATNPQAMREVTEIHHAGRKAAALTQQLLAFSRRQPFNVCVINLNALIEKNAGILRQLVGAAGQIEFELAANLPNTRTDPTQFQQVLLNLVLNARVALRAKGRIVVSTIGREILPQQQRRTSDLRPGRYVVLTVKDNGTGMEAETQRHLFEPFFTTKPEGKGTGLGLALVYGVVQQSGGEITVHSELLAGSTFEIILPATADAAAEPPPAAAPLPATRGHETVALLEEDEVVRKMVAGILTADGYRVTAAGTVSALAQEPAPPRPVQLLIAPPSPEVEKHGRRLLKQSPGLRFLCIRPSEQTPALVSWISRRRQANIAKPYALSELVRATRKLLDA